MKDDFLQWDTLLGKEGISYLLRISVAEWVSSTWLATNLVAYPVKSGFWLKVEFPDDFLVLNQNNPSHSGFHGTQTTLITSVISCYANSGFLLLLYHIYIIYLLYLSFSPGHCSNHRLFWLPPPAFAVKIFQHPDGMWGHQDSSYSGVSDSAYKPHLFPHSLPYFTLKEVSLQLQSSRMNTRWKLHQRGTSQLVEEDGKKMPAPAEYTAISQAV